MRPNPPRRRRSASRTPRTDVRAGRRRPSPEPALDRRWHAAPPGCPLPRRSLGTTRQLSPIPGRLTLAHLLHRPASFPARALSRFPVAARDDDVRSTGERLALGFALLAAP